MKAPHCASLKPVLIFTGLYMTLAIAGAIGAGNREFIIYIGKYDQLTHAYGFGITSWLCWHILKCALRSPDGSPVRPTPGILVLCVAAGMGFGAFNEVVEFAATRILPDTNVGDYANTGWDLVANLFGSLITVVIIRWGGSPCRTESHSRQMTPGNSPPIPGRTTRCDAFRTGAQVDSGYKR